MLVMGMTEGGWEAEEDKVEVGRDGKFVVARMLEGGRGLDTLVLKARSSAAQSSKVALISPFLTSVSSISGEHLAEIWGIISERILGLTWLDSRNLDSTMTSTHTLANGCKAEIAFTVSKFSGPPSGKIFVEQRDDKGEVGACHIHFVQVHRN